MRIQSCLRRKISMSNPSWYDIEMRGRRLEAVCKRMYTEFSKYIDTKPDVAVGYLEALLRTEKMIQPLMEQMIGLNRFLKRHEPKADTIHWEAQQN